MAAIYTVDQTLQVNDYYSKVIRAKRYKNVIQAILKRGEKPKQWKQEIEVEGETIAQNMAALADTAVINQRSIYCVLYLNGEYTGIYTIKERPNASLYAGLAGVDEDYVECFEAPAGYTSEFYEQTVGFVNSHDMTLDENYAQFCQAMDIDSLIDWLILEGYCANTDLTSGNLRYARSPLADGKWHLLFSVS